VCAKRGVLLEAMRRAAEGGADVEVHPVARRPVVMPLLQAAPDIASGEPIEVEAGEPSIGAEDRGAGMAGTRSALVIVRIADHSDPVAELEGVEKQPFEGAPGGVDLHRAFD